MKVYIGPFRSWIGPYQIAEALCFWAKPVSEEYGFKRKPDWVHKFGTWLADKKDGSPTTLTRLCNWIHSKKERKVKIKIHDYDSWNADSTLALIILPVLKQLQETKHGSGHVDDADVPEELKSTSAPALTQEERDCGGTDANWHKRWDWVLGEMIWAFEQMQPDCDWEDQYWKVKPEIDWSDHPEDEGKKIIPVRWNVQGELDMEGRAAHDARIQNGLRLFGTYYRGLWD